MWKNTRNGQALRARCNPLDRVTLCCIDCANHELALAALDQCVRKCASRACCSSPTATMRLEGVDCVRIAPIDSREAYSRFVIKELAALHRHRLRPARAMGRLRRQRRRVERRLPRLRLHRRQVDLPRRRPQRRQRRLLAAQQAPARSAARPARRAGAARGRRDLPHAIAPISRRRTASASRPEAVADRFSFEASYFDAPAVRLPRSFQLLDVPRQRRARRVSSRWRRRDPGLGAMPAAREELRRPRAHATRRDGVAQRSSRRIRRSEAARSSRLLEGGAAHDARRAGRRATRPVHAAAASATRSATEGREPP